MQCQRSALRASCRARNAYSPSLAINTAFGSTTKRRRDDDERIPSAWEPTDWEELPRVKNIENEQQEPTIRSIEWKMPTRKFRKALRQQAAKQYAVESEKRRWTEGETPTEEDSSHQQHVRTILRKYARRKVGENRRPQEDNVIARLRYWAGPRYGSEVVDAEGWKAHIGMLVAMSRQIYEDKKKGRNLLPHEQDAAKVAFDYPPLAVLPRAPASEDMPLPPAPWELRFSVDRTAANGDGKAYAELVLSQEMARFADFMRPTRLENAARDAATKEVLDLVRRVITTDIRLPTAVEIHGSQKTGLAMPTSDVDIRIWAEDHASLEQNQYFYGQTMHARLAVIYRALRTDPQRFGLATLREGTYPIINFQHRPSGIDFQIVATDSALPQEAVMRKHLAKFPRLHDFFIVIRAALEVRGLLPVHNGGTGAYGCFVMLLPPLLRHSDRNIHLAAMLHRFLGFYDPCTQVNLAQKGVACHPRQVFLKHKPDPNIKKFEQLAQERGDPVRAGQWRMCQLNELQPYLLTLQDPANPTNDLGARVHAIQHIIGTFIRLQADLQQWCKTVESGHYKPFLSTLVGRPDLLYRNQRKTLEDYGRTSLADGFRRVNLQTLASGTEGPRIRKISVV